MTNYIFDASALIVLLNGEPGSEIAMEHASNITMSSVNVAEVMTVMVRRGVANLAAKQALRNTVANIIDFDFDQAIICGEFYKTTKPYGLSLGDRACLSLAKATKMPVLTADKAWGKLSSLDVEIKMLR